MEEILQQILIFIVTITFSLLTVVAKKYISKLNLEENEKQITNLILEGITEAEDKFVREAKLMAEDGKLTAEEISKAKKIAIDYVKNNATPNLLKIVGTWSERKFDSLIKQYLIKVR